jgi:UDP-3-O-[3-hydroxymyristoyl] glucosamine N-acyltransferase
MSITLGEIATQFGCELTGDPATPISAVATLSSGREGAISFFANSAYADALASTSASAVILKDSELEKCPVAALISSNPYLTFARVALALYPDEVMTPGIHARACVDETSRIADTAHVAANAFIDADCELGEYVYVGPGAVVGPRCRVGDRTRLLANCTLVQDVTIGLRGIIHSGAVVGSDGFGNAMSGQGWVKVKQVGGVVIGDDVEIGSNTTVDRGAIGDTVLENGVRLDNLVQIAHNVHVGEHTAMAGMTGIAGSTTIGKRCMFAGRSGSVGHVTICDDVIVSACTFVSKDVKEPGVYSASFPAEKDKNWKRKAARFRRIDDIVNRIKVLEKKKPPT